MSSFRGQQGVRNGPRNKSFSGPSRRADLRISGPLPYPLPPAAASSSPEEQYVRNSHGIPAAAGNESQPQTQQHQYPHLQSSLPPTSRTLSRPSIYYRQGHHVLASHAHQHSISTVNSREPNMHRRRASTLRSVMRKLFGRKRHSQGGDGLVEDDRESDPPLGSSPRPGDVRQKSPSLPTMGEGRPRTRSRRSQSLPGHRDVHLPQDSLAHDDGSKLSPNWPNVPASQSPNDDGLPRVPSAHGRLRRRATLPSIVNSSHSGEPMAEPAGEPASEPGPRVDNQASRVSRTESAAARDRSSKGTVVKRRRRRSRSTNELRNVANAHRMSPIQWRHYSEAARPKRASSTDVSHRALSPSRPETKGSEHAEGELADASSGDRSYRHDAESENGYEFGAFMGNMQDTSGAGLVQRVATLEVKLMDLELAIAKLQGQDVPSFQPNELDKSPEQHIETAGELQPPPAQDPSFLFTSMHSTPMVTPPRSSPAGDPNRESGLTVRPQASSIRPSSSHDPGFRGISVEQYSALTTLVRREQTARKHLESQVTQLRKDIEGLCEKNQKPDPGSFYHPSSPDSLASPSSSIRRISPQGSDNNNNNTSNNGRDEFDMNKSERSFYPGVSHSSQSAGSDRGAYGKLASPDSTVNPNQFPGMI